MAMAAAMPAHLQVLHGCTAHRLRDEVPAVQHGRGDDGGVAHMARAAVQPAYAAGHAWHACMQHTTGHVGRSCKPHQAIQTHGWMHARWTGLQLWCKKAADKEGYGLGSLMLHA